MHLTMVLSEHIILTGSSMPKYDMDKGKGKVQTSMKVVNPLLETIVVKGQVKLNIHSSKLAS